MKNTRTRRSSQLVVMALSVFSILNLSDVHAEPKSGEIVAADLLTVKETEIGSGVTPAGHSIDDSGTVRYRLWGLP